jgi:hemerythrin-like domain-containing protein
MLGRRGFAVGASALGLVGCGQSHESHEENGAIITPGEDLMGEHGVVRRVMVVWNELDGRLRRGEPVDAAPLASSVDLVQWFIERYHERTEESEVFPRLVHAGREVALVHTLLAQHEAGRAITRELASLTRSAITEASRPRVITLLADHCRMYAAHASREDTIVFPALRELVGEGWAELGERFEENEDRTLGEGGMERALAQVAAVERAYGLDDLATFTPATIRS